MKVLLVTDGDAYFGVEYENGHREELASNILSGNDAWDELEDKNVDWFNIVEIPDEATDYIIDSTDYDDSNGDGFYRYTEYIYYVIDGKIHKDPEILISFKYDWKTEKYLESKEVE